MPFNLINELQTSSQRISDKTFYGIVVEPNDPYQIDRAKIRIRDRHKNFSDDDLPWAIRLDGEGGAAPGVREVRPPPKGVRVLCTFLDNTPYHPAYWGAVYTQDTKLKEFSDYYPEVEGRIDIAGNLFKYVTKQGHVEWTIIHRSGLTFFVDNDGNLSITTAKNCTLNVNGNYHVVASGNVVIEAKGNADFRSGGATNLDGHTTQVRGSGGNVKVDNNVWFTGSGVHTFPAIDVVRWTLTSPTTPSSPQKVTARTRPKVKNPANMKDY